MTTALIDEFETLFSKNFGAAKCWRCDDAGEVDSRSIVPRRLPCVCEAGQTEIEGRGFHKRVQQSRQGRES
jgi:hypothetical protein